MEQKTKILVIAAVAFVAICLFLLIIRNNALMREKMGLEEDKKSLTAENDNLRIKVDQERKAKADIQSQLVEMKRSLDEAQGVKQERDDLQQKYDQLSKERDNILKELSTAKSASQEKPKSPAQGGDDAYWSGIVKAKADLELKLGNLKEEMATIKNNLETLQKEKSSLQLDINNLTNDKNELSAKVAYNEKMIDLLSLDLVNEKNDKRKIQDNVKIVRDENENLKKELKSVNKQKLALEAKIQKVGSEKRDLEQRVVAVNATLDDKASDILDIKQRIENIKEDKGLKDQREQRTSESVELPAIIVKSPDSQADVLNITGKVLEINRENNFVIIDVGEDSGVRQGMSFAVYHGVSQIGSIEVVQTRKSVSACDIRQAIEPIKVGDTIK